MLSSANLAASHVSQQYGLKRTLTLKITFDIKKSSCNAIVIPTNDRMAQECAKVHNKLAEKDS